jgi:hypothetical protein
MCFYQGLFAVKLNSQSGITKQGHLLHWPFCVELKTMIAENRSVEGRYGSLVLLSLKPTGHLKIPTELPLPLKMKRSTFGYLAAK